MFYHSKPGHVAGPPPLTPTPPPLYTQTYRAARFYITIELFFFWLIFSRPSNSVNTGFSIEFYLTKP